MSLQQSRTKLVSLHPTLFSQLEEPPCLLYLPLHYRGAATKQEERETKKSFVAIVPKVILQVSQYSLGINHS